MICFMDSYIISSPNEVVPNVTGSELVGGPEILRMDQGNPDAPPAIPHAEQAMGDLDLALRLGPPSPTKEALERELSTFLSSFGNREVRRDVLEGTIRKLDLNSASPEKLFLRIRQLMQELSNRPVAASTAKKALLKALKEWEKGDA
ncbi:hypothetical protein RND71_043803 [Anisodus tanguticus]|uniref:Uncharacterized protein n=1 Tax=Anisodus tanguticus TaxID=243964 RepID=A0AAE1QPQ2_9SOLA|nr:hypothetical protein RND71_043803 [Anisodus tanguticus]